MKPLFEFPALSILSGVRVGSGANMLGDNHCTNGGGDTNACNSGSGYSNSCGGGSDGGANTCSEGGGDGLCPE